MPRGIVYRTFNSYIDLTREYYAAHGYEKPYAWARHREVPFAALTKPVSECTIALLTTADLSKPPGETLADRHLARKVFAQPSDRIPEHFFTEDLMWDQVSTHTDDNDSFMPLNRLAEAADDGRIKAVSKRFYGVMTDYSQGRASKKSAPKVLEFCREDGVDAVILPAL